MGIKLSACVIVKNEEKNLPDWLDCMKAVADEMVVVDTGSTDNTVALAKAAGAKVYFFKWINDFSAAKNYAIEQATGDWILFLDADETFTDAARRVLRQELERFDKDKNVACLLNRLIDVDVDKNNRVFNNSLLPRIFRRSPYIRYRGAIHEQVGNTQGNKKMVFAKELEIIHTGYSSRICRLKAERNLPIILQELDKATTQEERNQWYPYLADTYGSLDDYENVIFYGQKCIDNDCRMVGDPTRFYGSVTMAMFNARKPHEETLAKLDEASEKYPASPVFPFIRGMVLEEMENYVGAEKAVLQGFELRQKFVDKMQQGSGLSDTSIGFVPYAYERLGKIYSLKGDKQRAAENYLLALKQHKYQVESLRGLCRVLAGAEDVEIIGLLNSLYDREQDGRFIVHTLKGQASGGVLSYYGKNITDFEQGYIYMANGRFDSAGVKLGEHLRELVQVGMLAADNLEAYPQDGYLDVLVSDKYRELFKGNTKERDAVRRLKEYRIRAGIDK